MPPDPGSLFYVFFIYVPLPNPLHQLYRQSEKQCLLNEKSRSSDSEKFFCLELPGSPRPKNLLCSVLEGLLYFFSATLIKIKRFLIDFCRNA